MEKVKIGDLIKVNWGTKYLQDCMGVVIRITNKKIYTITMPQNINMNNPCQSYDTYVSIFIKDEINSLEIMNED